MRGRPGQTQPMPWTDGQKREDLELVRASDSLCRKQYSQRVAFDLVVRLILVCIHASWILPVLRNTSILMRSLGPIYFNCNRSVLTSPS